MFNRGSSPRPRHNWIVRQLLDILDGTIVLILKILPRRRPRGTVYVPNKPDKKFELQVRRGLSFLFERYAIQITSNVKYRHFGSAEITIRAANVDIRIFNDGRDHELRVNFGPAMGNGVWENVDVALAAATGEVSPRSRYDGYYGSDPSKALLELADLLQPRFDRLNEAFSEENYPVLRSRLAEAQRDVNLLKL